MESLREHLLPEGVGAFRLAAHNEAGIDKLANENRLATEVAARCGQVGDGGIVELLLIPAEEQAAAALLPTTAKTAGQIKPQVHVAVKAESFSEDVCQVGLSVLQRELDIAPPGSYSPPSQSCVPVPPGSDWVREVLQNLSGIQRKSKGRGQLSQQVFHQCSEFAALYVHKPKSSVHLIITPRRLLRRQEVSFQEASMLHRMAHYTKFLAQCLARPGVDIISGLRVRAGTAQQLHAHLVSLDLVAPCTEDLERHHYRDFTGGVSYLLPLTSLGELLAAASGRAEQVISGASTSRGAATSLICHRCGQCFGDAMRELAGHLRRCQAPCRSKKSTAPQEREGREEDIILLQEMGFGSGQSREALHAALIAVGGSVERAVEMLLPLAET